MSKKGYIYKITSPDNKIYIGQTINPKNRKKQYKYKSFKYQIKLWNHCEKYSWNPSDTFEIIDELDIESKKELNDREIYWITLFDSFNNGFNCDKGGGSRMGFKHTEESKRKISKTRREKPYIKATKRIICLNNGKIYNSLKLAAEELGLDRTKISMVCNNKREHTQQYRFKFFNIEEEINSI